MLTHKGTVTIETPRLLLRRAEIQDADAMYKNWASDPEVTKFLTWPPHESPAASEEIIAKWIAEYQKKDFYQWMIVLKEIDAPIGSLIAVSDERTESAQIGYCIGKKWWHQGIMPEALGAVMDFLFDEVGFNRVEARHDPNNPNSGKVMSKCGMKYEGTLRQADRNNQGICDCSFYGLLASDRK